MVPGAPITALAMEGPTAASIRSSSAWRHFPETAVIAREINFTAAEGTPEAGSKRRVAGAQSCRRLDALEKRGFVEP